MKIYQCDWCEKQKPCRSMNIDGRLYDICQECRDEISAKLKGKGDAAANPLTAIQESFGKNRQAPWPNPSPWTLETPRQTLPAIYGPQIIGKSHAEKMWGGRLLCGDSNIQ